MKPSVLGRTDLQFLGQKGNQCGPSAAEGHAELRLLLHVQGAIVSVLVLIVGRFIELSEDGCCI